MNILNSFSVHAGTIYCLDITVIGFLNNFNLFIFNITCTLAKLAPMRVLC